MEKQLIDALLQYKLISIPLFLLICSGIYKLLNLQFVQNFFNKRIQNNARYDNIKLNSFDNVQNNFFDTIKTISEQNNANTQFLKNYVLKQFSKLNSKYDILQRYIISIVQQNQKNCGSLKTIQQKLTKPFLNKQLSLWLMQSTMQLHVRKKLQYISSIYKKYKQDVKKQQIIADIYRVFKQITREQVQLLSNFRCNYGNFAKPLQQILVTKQFDQFIYNDIAKCLDFQNQEKTINDITKVMSKYVQTIVGFIQRY